MVLRELAEHFRDIFGDGGEIRLFFAPAGVNLIGEHTDYNGGHVFPLAIGFGTYGAVRLRSDSIVQFAFENGSAPETPSFASASALEVRGFSLAAPLRKSGDDDWIDYPKGVISAFQFRGETIPCGFDALCAVDIPREMGIDFRASLEVLTGLILRNLFDLPGIDELELAALGQRAESRFLERRYTGIMNQIASAAGRAGNAVFLGTEKMKYELMPLKMGDVKLVLTGSRVKKGDHTTDYEARHEACEKALKKLQSVVNIHHLCDLSWDKFESCKDVIMNDVWTKRARHVVYEDARAIRAASALRVGNIRRLGELMNQSHISLRDDYEVSCPEIDFLVEQAWEVPGVIGSRMTGGGFGGCTLSLVREEAIPNFEETIAAAYSARFGLIPEFYVVEAGDGAREMTEFR